MECDICMLEWNSLNRIPRLLTCGHTFCENCLIDIIKKNKQNNKKIFLCPNCNHKEERLKNENDIKKLIKNFNLLNLYEKAEQRKTNCINESMLNIQKDNYQNENNNNNPYSILNNENNNNNDLEIPKEILEKNKTIIPKIENENIEENSLSQLKIADLEDFKFDYNNLQICEKHKLPIHSYALGTKFLFCSECIKNSKLKTRPLPSVLKSLKNKLNESIYKVSILKNEINFLKEFFENFLIEFENKNLEKIEKTFNTLFNIVKYFYNDSKEILKQCVKEQKKNINTYFKEIEKLNTKIDSYENNLLNIINFDIEKNFNYNFMDEVYSINNKIKYCLNYNMDIHLFSFNIEFNEMQKENLFSLIKNSYNINIDFLKINNNFPKIKTIIQKDFTWPCLCGNKNTLDEIECSNCHLLQKIFDDFERKDLFQTKIFERKKLEGLKFKNLYKLPSIKYYYALDILWYLQWKSYVTNDIQSKNLSNENKNIIDDIVMPPGPITNYNLVFKNNKDNFVLKKGLNINDDYIIINDLVWDFFYLNYNGGPIIKLNNKSDIYKSLNEISNKKFLTYNELRDLYFTDEKKENINKKNYDNFSLFDNYK